MERRQSARVGTTENEIVLEWHETSEVRSSEGQIVNISDRGALVLPDSLVPFTDRVFIGMKTPVRTDRIAAQVVRRRTSSELGLVFSDAYQWDLKLAASIGVDFKDLFGLSDDERFSHSGD
jgi:hypothetical protein